MSLLLDASGWNRRRATVADALQPLAAGMVRDLERALDTQLSDLPGKAVLSREGGRCPADATLLEFDPYDRRRHRCPRCGAVVTGVWHERFWPYWYHLWLAERAVHAALVGALGVGDGRPARFAADVLDVYSERYLGFPNVDNVLGPSRPFFSTYLESIWLLQLCIALDTLERATTVDVRALGARVRERLIEPSARLIASYDEGVSNRQVWNVAALMASAVLLGRSEELARTRDAAHGLHFLLQEGLLGDGTWYEGENYHMFAHRGLWYAVTIAEAQGLTLDAALTARFQAGFAAPFATVLPDLTLPSRRDSQYAISTRQPRFAELCELGLARADDPRLAAVLSRLYEHDDAVPEGDDQRWRTSADVERNIPPMRLGRQHLGWRSLLFARPTLPTASTRPPASTLLPDQGIAVLRRRAGAVYAALDYGHAGGGHGHPDRLQLLLAHGTVRVLDDFGTGSYVDASLHWYRSTLAHNAPLVDGRSQDRGAGRLAAWDDAGHAGWVRATFTERRSGTRFMRTAVVTDTHLVDEVAWEAPHAAQIDLPIHAPILLPGDGFSPAPMPGGDGLEDGFDHLRDAAVRPLSVGQTLVFGTADEPGAVGLWLSSDSTAELWRARAPGPPGTGDHLFHVVRTCAERGRVRFVWSWTGDVASVRFGPDDVVVDHADGVSASHTPTREGWAIDVRSGSTREWIRLAGVIATAGDGDPQSVVAEPAPATTAPAQRLGRARPLRFELGRPQYRASEPLWEEAGEPTASVTIAWDGRRLTAVVEAVAPAGVVLVPEGAVNPYDNEPPDIDGHGVQLYVREGRRRGGWVLVPAHGAGVPRARSIVGWSGLELVAARSVTGERRFGITASVDLGPGDGSAGPHRIIDLGVVINDAAPGRRRRRGQLVLGGRPGERTYLRGDRIEEPYLLPFALDSGDLS